MMRQIEQRARIPLLTEKGLLTRPSWAAEDLYVYNKEMLRRRGARAEWEFYQLSDRHMAVQLCYGHAGHVGRAAVRFLDLDKKTRFDAGRTRLFPGDSFDLDFSAGQPHSIRFDREGFELSAGFDGAERRLHCLTPELTLDLAFSDECDALFTAMPYDRQKQFCCRCRKTFLDLRGRVRVRGRDCPLTGESFVLLDSIRGVMPGQNKQVWGSGSCEWGEHVLGITLGWGTGDRRAATDNALFWDGVIHKLGRVKECSRFDDPMRPVSLREEDGRLELCFTPRYDSFTNANYLIARSRSHQVFGTADGTVVLDDGRQLEVADMPFFLTHTDNKW